VTQSGNNYLSVFAIRIIVSDKPPSDLVKVNFRIKEREYLEMKRLVASKKYSSISELVRHAIELLLEEYTGKV